MKKVKVDEIGIGKRTLFFDSPVEFIMYLRDNESFIITVDPIERWCAE